MLPGVRYEIETNDLAEVPESQERYLDAFGRLAARMRSAAELTRGS